MICNVHQFIFRLRQPPMVFTYRISNQTVFRFHYIILHAHGTSEGPRFPFIHNCCQNISKWHSHKSISIRFKEMTIRVVIMEPHQSISIIHQVYRNDHVDRDHGTWHKSMSITRRSQNIIIRELQVPHLKTCTPLFLPCS